MGAHSVDLMLYDSVLSQILCRLFYHHSEEKWRGDSIVMTNELSDFTSTK